MGNTRGKPGRPAGKSKEEVLQIRLSAAEKQSFQRAAELDGKKVSEWIRDRLRRLSREELKQHGEIPAFFLDK